MIVAAWFLAYFLHYSPQKMTSALFLQAIHFLPLLVFVQLLFYWYFGLYRGVWRFASVPDLVRIIKAVVAACIVSVLLLFFFAHLSIMPRSLFPLYGLLLIALLSAPRIFYRYIKDHKYLNSGEKKRVMIIGAGGAGEHIVRDLLRNKGCYNPVVFVDDALDTQGKEIHGIRVKGICDDIPKIVKDYDIDLAIIAIPSANASSMRRIVDLCNQAQIPFQTLPSLDALASGRVAVSELREVDLEDLLGREQVELDWKAIQSSIVGKVVLVTGGGGSIGSELCRQIGQLNPKLLIVIERSEYNLYQLQQEIHQKFPDLNFKTYLEDVGNRLMIKHIFQKNKPDIVFHAAAYKHVPILEAHVCAAVRNNIQGTEVLARAAKEFGVTKFILISTDKAVRPTNIMGASKRSAEILCQSLNEPNSTHFVTVRFGNVLGSSGSVIPLFKRQLAVGGPITVTHPDVTRFFMTIPEAARLILQAATIGQGGEIFVLDMGQPVKIRYLAEQLIRLSGKEPDLDIKIIYSGLRPGEKLYEELFYQNEDRLETKHPKIFQAKSNVILHDSLMTQLAVIKQALSENDTEQLVILLKAFVPEFQDPGAIPEEADT